MSEMVWNPEWETGVGQIDEQHRQLLSQLDSLMTAIHQNNPGDCIPGILGFLGQYVEEHFALEEAQMAATSYPRLPAHRAIHNDMRMRFGRLLQGFQEDPSAVTEELIDFLTDWLVRHINIEDRIMANHLLRFAATKPWLVP